MKVEVSTLFLQRFLLDHTHPACTLKKTILERYMTSILKKEFRASTAVYGACGVRSSLRVFSQNFECFSLTIRVSSNIQTFYQFF